MKCPVAVMREHTHSTRAVLQYCMSKCVPSCHSGPRIKQVHAPADYQQPEADKELLWWC